MNTQQFLRAVVTALVVLTAPLAIASTYQTPSPALAKLVDQSATPQALASSNGEWLALLTPSSNPSIADMAQQEMRLAGLRVNPDLLAPTRPMFSYTEINLQNLSNGKSRKLDGLPAGSIKSALFSPDGKYLSVMHKSDAGLFLYLHDLANNSTKKILQPRVNSVIPNQIATGRDIPHINGMPMMPFMAMDSDHVWSPNSSAIFTRIETAQNGAPKNGETPTGPSIQESTGEKAPARTFQDLLNNEKDAAWFEFLATSQLVRVDLQGAMVKLGKAGAISEFRPAPDSLHVLVKKIKRPYSYIVPYLLFSQSIEVWNSQGELVKHIANLALAENLPAGFDAVPTGRRNVEWRSDMPATLVWAEALDGGDMKNAMPHHDQVFTWTAPFAGEPQKLLATEWRFEGLLWGENNLALLYEWRFSDRAMRAWYFDSSNPAGKTLWQNRSQADAYTDPGAPQFTRSKLGAQVIKADGQQSIFLFGLGASAQGNQPFVDKYSFATKSNTRLWQSKAPYLEVPAAVLNFESLQAITTRESNSEPPNFYLSNLSKRNSKALTKYAHPTPEFLGVKKELVQYKRADGVDLSGTLYLPSGYKKADGALPVLMWAYPREFKDAAVAGQVRTSPYQFNRISYWGPLPLLAKGYAVFDGPTMPIIGEGNAQPNDTYREQLVSSAQAAIDVLVERGVADKKRIAIGGHSYGAFMTGNLLAHSDLFCTGIARSGAYNRTLTPFGFQGEERTFWEAEQVYDGMSPFHYADKINEPILMIHGEADNNSGTFPIQSQRMFAAIKGLGGKARLVMLPLESHRYTARESLLHMLWETEQWLQTNNQCK